MENYLMLNGNQIDLTEEQATKIKQSFCIDDVLLSDLEVGDTFKIGEYEFFVLERSGGTTAVILKDLLHKEKKFGSNNNYDGSDVDKLCIEFGEVIEKLVGEENLIEHTVDLTADDGLKCYGSINRKMSLITAQMYRNYVYIFEEHPVTYWWWLSTAFSTSKHDDTSWIKCVSPLGFINYGSYYGSYCVRPFCILKSNIFVSK